jgi:hypothetical protein
MDEPVIGESALGQSDLTTPTERPYGMSRIAVSGGTLIDGTGGTPTPEVNRGDRGGHLQQLINREL